jgi:hypothetical protein
MRRRKRDPPLPYLEEVLDGSFGEVEERGPSAEPNALVHRGRRVHEEEDDRHPLTASKVSPPTREERERNWLI